MDYAGFAPQPKPEPMRRVKNRKARKESVRKKSVRELCVDRDGYCRIGKDADDYTDCLGPSEWCHSRTRGQEPDKRHFTIGSFMGCRCHHREYDAGELAITAVDDALGCDGDLIYARPSF